MNTSTSLLDITDLHFAHTPEAVVFMGWSARLPPGLTVVCGDESSGKTTLLRLLAGELTGRGRITLDGAPVRPEDVFWQDPRAAPDDTVASAYLAAQAARWPAWDEAAAQAHIDGLSLREHIHKPFFALSNGGRRKVWLTAALASGAPLTLMDEIFAALDTPSIRYLTAALQQTAAQAPGRWLLAAHWDALPGVPDERLLRLGQGVKPARCANAGTASG
ncbi:MAG: ABC transporter ATP-binding protein [Hydrogenophaga sp.]|nr:ABC transporter ATP-binding protein [Hydrogenophaga sp.]